MDSGLGSGFHTDAATLDFIAVGLALKQLQCEQVVPLVSSEELVALFGSEG